MRLVGRCARTVVGHGFAMTLDVSLLGRRTCLDHSDPLHGSVTDSCV